MSLQRINVKLMTAAPADWDVAPLLKIFSRWRHHSDHPQGWIDLADYRHVPDGPKAMLVGRRGNLVYDVARGQPGLLYRNKRDLEGTAQDRVAAAVQRALSLVVELQAEDDYPADLALDPRRLRIEVSDRIGSPNDDETHARLSPAIQPTLDALYGESGYRAEREPDPTRLYGFTVAAEGACSLDDLRRRLAKPGTTPQSGNGAASPRVSAPDPSDSADDASGAPPRRWRISALDAARLMSEEGFAYLDVRTVREFAAGHPEGAYNIPVVTQHPTGRGLIANPVFLEVALASFAKDAKIIVGCRSGGRSRDAREQLKRAGFTEVLDNYAGYDAGRSPEGALEPGWSQQGLPTHTTAFAGRSYAELASAALS